MASLLVTAGIVGASAVATAFVAVPAARRFALKDISTEWLADELDFDGVDDGTLSMKDGSQVAIYGINGLSYDTVPIQEAVAEVNNRAQMLFDIGELKVKVRLYVSKRLQSLDVSAKWPNAVLSQVGKAESDRYNKAYRVRWFMVLETKLPIHLSKACEVVETALSDYKPRRLKTGEQECEISAFCDYTITGELRETLPKHSRLVSANIQTSGLTFDRASGVIRAETPTSRYYKVISVMAWSPEVNGEVIGDLLALDVELDVVQLNLAHDKDATKLMLARREKELSNPLFGGKSAALAEVVALDEELGEGNVSIATTQAVVILRATSEQELDRNATKVSELLRKRRVHHAVETQAAARMWFNKMPTRNRMARPLKLTNDNVAALWCFNKSPRGLPASPWGDGAIRMFTTRGGEPYRFQFHVSTAPQSKGHFLVFAPTGSGKSTLVMHLLAGTAKYDGVRNYIFDSHEGTRYMAECFGGRYMNFAGLKLNPLDAPEDTPAVRQRIMRVFQAILGDDYKSEFDKELALAIEVAFKPGLKREQRTLNNIYEHSFSKNKTLHRLLEPWVTTGKGRGGRYAHVFNAPRDEFMKELASSYMLGINMNQVLSDKGLGAPVIAHMAEAIRTAAEQDNSKGFTIFIDEAANLMGNEKFAEFVTVMFREYRKLNGVVGMAFQDPSALTRSNHADAIIENAGTIIIYPNATANLDAYKPLKLNEEQEKFITSNSKREVLIIKRDSAMGVDESVIVNVDLAYQGDGLKYYKSGSDALKQLKKAQKEGGAEWQTKL